MISIIYTRRLSESDHWPLKLKVKNVVLFFSLLCSFIFWGGSEEERVGGGRNAGLQRRSHPLAGSSSHGSHFACKAVVTATR